MNYKYQFTTEEERQQLIAQHHDKELTETQYLISGNFLIFADPSPTDLEIRELKRQNADFMVAMAELATLFTAGGGTA